MDIDTYIVTCEHGGNQIPAPLRRHFDGWRSLLDSHRGYDAGALTLAQAFARALDAPLVAATVSRLVIDLNRSLGHPQLYSAATRAVSAPLRAAIVAEHYRPYRNDVERRVAQMTARGHRVLHISAHSFTPELDGHVRMADVGLLYNPARPGEVALAACWKAALAATDPSLRVRRNYPYAGIGDGLTQHLRKRFAARAYVGIELEVNQAIVQAGGRRWAALRRVLIETLRDASSVAPRGRT
jgi:predicted N-formylglutamate amidohydrolase